MIDKMPNIALGTWMITKPNEISEVIPHGLENGYRHIDTAQIYFNEELIGKELEQLDIPREEYWITSKVWVLNYKYHTYTSVRESLLKLKTNYIDTMLLHADAGKERNVIAYKELMKAREEGLIRGIGVSNFSIEALEQIKEATGEYPKYNQIICSPKQRIVDLEKFCKDNNIRLMGYSSIRPYYNPNPYYKDPGFTADEKKIVDEIAAETNSTPAIVLLRWSMQHDYIILPKTAKSERLDSNLEVQNITLSEDQMKRLDGLNAFDYKTFLATMKVWEENRNLREDDEKIGVRISPESDKHFVKNNIK